MYNMCMYGGGAPAVTPLTKDQYALAHLRRRRRGRLPRYGTAIALPIKQFRSQSDVGLAHSHHERAPIWLSTWSVRRAAWMDWLD